jgi:hypothetical protein
VRAFVGVCARVCVYVCVCVCADLSDKQEYPDLSDKQEYARDLRVILVFRMRESESILNYFILLNFGFLGLLKLRHDSYD